MNQHFTNLPELMNGAERTVPLKTEQFEQAVQISDRLPTEERRWNAYLNSLALLGFQVWLSQRAPDLVIQSAPGSVLNPVDANLIDAVCNLDIAGFRVCLIRMERGDDDTVVMPRAVIDLPEFIAHFYVLVDVREERQEVLIDRVASYETLATQPRSHPLQPRSDWTYAVPPTWFDSEFTPFIVSLRCGDIYKASLPVAPARSHPLHHQWNEFAAALPRINQSDQELWEALTWEQGVALLTCPELGEWFYQQQMQSFDHQPTTDQVGIGVSLQPLVDQFTQRVVNTWNWMEDTLDEISTALGWVMQPALISTLRSNRTDDSGSSNRKSYKAAIATLSKRGITLPEQDCNACINLELGDEKLRLRAIPIPTLPTEDSEEPVSEWRLFVILDAQPDHTLSQGVTLQVSDQTELLDEQVFDQDADDAYLFSCVVGGCDEQFIVTIQLANGLSLTLPPFAYQPE